MIRFRQCIHSFLLFLTVRSILLYNMHVIVGCLHLTNRRTFLVIFFCALPSEQKCQERGQKLTFDNIVNLLIGWFSDNFNFFCIICLYFGISNLKIYPVYTNSFKYIFPDLNTNNAQFGIFTSFWRLFCTNLRMKCHHRHILVYAEK